MIMRARALFCVCRTSYPLRQSTGLLSCQSGWAASSWRRHVVTVSAAPQVCLHDVHTSLSITGLPAATPVTLRAEVFHESGKKFCSHGHYNSDESGSVFVDRAESVGGSYTGVLPAGLLTTLAPAPGEFPYLRLYKKNPLQPYEITVSAHPGHHPVSATAPSDPWASVLLTRYLAAPGVRRRPVREGRVRGVLYEPPPQYGPTVGVVDMFGAVGGIMEFRAAMLASRGYTVLALPFFGYEDLPPLPDVLELEYFMEAVNFVMAQNNVIPDRCGMITVSKSTDFGLLVSTKMPALTAVVCIGVVGYSFDTNITYQGKTIVKGAKFNTDGFRIDEQGCVSPTPEVMLSLLELVGSNPEYQFKLEESSSDCHYLLVAGSDDPWGCELAVNHLKKYMAERGLSHKVEGIIYQDAGHLIEPPYGPSIRNSFQRMLPVQKQNSKPIGTSVPISELPGGASDESGYVTGVPILFGGYPRGVCNAQVDLWARLHAFLNRRVRDASPWYQDYLLNKERK